MEKGKGGAGEGISVDRCLEMEWVVVVACGDGGLAGFLIDISIYGPRLATSCFGFFACYFFSFLYLVFSSLHFVSVLIGHALLRCFHVAPDFEFAGKYLHLEFELVCRLGMLLHKAQGLSTLFTDSGTYVSPV